MNFRNVTSIIIPQGSVSAIIIQGTTYWQREQSLSTFTTSDGDTLLTSDGQEFLVFT